MALERLVRKCRRMVLRRLRPVVAAFPRFFLALTVRLAKPEKGLSLDELT